MTKSIRKSLVLVILSILCLSQVGCTTNSGLEISPGARTYHNYDDPYYNVNPGYYGYYFGDPSPYYYHSDDYYDGYAGGYYYR